MVILPINMNPFMISIGLEIFFHATQDLKCFQSLNLVIKYKTMKQQYLHIGFLFYNSVMNTKVVRSRYQVKHNGLSPNNTWILTTIPNGQNNKTMTFPYNAFRFTTKMRLSLILNSNTTISFSSMHMGRHQQLQVLQGYQRKSAK